MDFPHQSPPSHFVYYVEADDIISADGKVSFHKIMKNIDEIIFDVYEDFEDDEVEELEEGESDDEFYKPRQNLLDSLYCLRNTIQLLQGSQDLRQP